MIEIKFNEQKSDLGATDNFTDELEDGAEEVDLEEEKRIPLEERIVAHSWRVRKRAYDYFYKNLKSIANKEDDELNEEDKSQVEVLLDKFQIEKFLEDSNPNSLEAALNVLIYISGKNIIISSIKEDKRVMIFKSAIEKAYACSKTPVKLRSKELMTNLLESAGDIHPYFEMLKTLLQFSPKKAKTVILAEQILQYFISEYGCEKFNYKYFMGTLISLIEKGNHGTRQAAFEVIKEIYKSTRSNILPHLKGLKEIYMKDLRKEFDKIEENEPNAPLPNRILNCDTFENEGNSHEEGKVDNNNTQEVEKKQDEILTNTNNNENKTKSNDTDPVLEDKHIIKINRRSVVKEANTSNKKSEEDELKSINETATTSNIANENAISLGTPIKAPVEEENNNARGAQNIDSADQNQPTQKQNGIDDFTRMLEEAMKKESEKAETENKSNTPNRIVVKKAANKRQTENNNNDDEEEKLNKAEVEDKINSMIGDEIAVLLQSTKWDEKKNGLIRLNEWIIGKAENSPSAIQSNLENFITYIKIVLKDYKESNFNIIREATVIYTTLIDKFTDKGFDKRFSAMIIKGLFEKLGESKLKDHISNLVFEMMETHGPRFIITNLLKYLNNEKKLPSNSVLREYSALFEKAIEDFGINFIPVKDIVDFCKVLSGNTNPQVRNASTSLLCVLYKYVGKDLKFLLKDIKESTLKVIETELDKVKIGEIPEPKRKLKQSALKEEGIKVVAQKGTNITSNAVTTTKVNQMDSLIPRVDISKKITAKLLKDINTGKWPEKKEACEAIEKILNDANMKILPNGLNDLFSTIKARLSDGNKNMVRLIVNLLSKLIDAVGSGFKAFTKTISSPLINNLSDKMQMLREDVLVCMDKWVAQSGFETIIVYIPHFLKQDNFEMRTELFKFLHKQKESFVFVKDKFDLKEFISPLLLCLQDKSQSIRTSAEELIVYSLKFINHSHYINALKDFKTAIVNTLKPILEKYRGVGEDDLGSGIIMTSNMSNSTTLKSDKSGELKKVYPTGLKSNSTVTGAASSEKSLTPNKKDGPVSSKDNSNTIKVVKKSNVSDKNIVKKKNKYGDDDPLASNSATIKISTSNSKILKDTKTGLSPRLAPTTVKKHSSQPNLFTIFASNPTMKQSKEKRLEIDKKYKFNLETINEDTVNKLKDQLKLVFSQEFLNKMFHDDLKHNIDAINSVNSILKELDTNINMNFNLFDYFDMILKWLGWKCLNNQNPSLVKILLEFLDILNEKITEKEISLNDTEGYIIITLLIDKLGVNNSKIKETTRILMEKYLDKVNNKCTNLINSSANKNPKVKAECIDMCATLIADQGVNIAAQKDMKFLAKLLSTNDNTLKNAIINLLAQVYIQIQDNLWTVLSDTPDKLKEMLYNNFYAQGLIKEDEEQEEGEGVEGSEDEIESETTGGNTNTNRNSRVKIDNQPKLSTSTANVESSASLHSSALSNKNLIHIGTTRNNAIQSSNSIHIPQTPGKKNSSLSSDSLTHVQTNTNQIINNANGTITYSRPTANRDNINSNQSVVSNLSSINVNDKDSLVYVLDNLNTGEMSERVNVILIIHELVHVKFAQSKHILIPNIDLIINAFVQALKNLFENKCLNEIPIKMGKYLLTVLYKIASNKELIKNISYDVLLALSEEVLSNLLIENLDKVGENQEGVVIIRSLNSTMLRVLENCNYTHVICVLLELVRKYRKISEKNKICGLAIKCLLKINIILPQIIECLSVDVILVKIHEVLSEIEETNPDLAATNQAEQNVIRYIKNLINELVKLRKEGIIGDYIKGVEGHSKKDNFIKKWIKSVLTSMSAENNQNIHSSQSIPNKQQEVKSPTPTQNIENLIAYKNKLQQNNMKTSKSPVHEIRNKPSSTSNSPVKRPKNSEMYNKIINLKSKLANYNQNSSSGNLQKQADDHRNSGFCKTFIDNSSDISSQLSQDNSGSNSKPMMSKINELKKKWNDVSNKSKVVNNFSLTPDKSKDRLDSETPEMKSKFSVGKMKNIYSGNKK